MFLFDEVDVVRTGTQALPMRELWMFLPVGYLFTIMIETPVLLFGLAPQVSVKHRLWCGAWLTACTYPIVVLVLPAVFLGSSRTVYLAVAETFAPAAECLLFWIAFRSRVTMNGVQWARCMAAVVLANLASFSFGEIMNHYGWFGLF